MVKWTMSAAGRRSDNTEMILPRIGVPVRGKLFAKSGLTANDPTAEVRHSSKAE